MDNLYVKASESKVTRWLRAKVERVAAVLAQQEAQANAKPHRPRPSMSR